MSNIPSIPDFSLTITQARQQIREFNIIYLMLNTALTENIVISERRNRLQFLRMDEQYTEYQQQDNYYERKEEDDRIFPLETVEIKKFNTKYDTDLDKAIIHIGPYADEYARSFNALALTIGCDIFFRNNAFDTAKEEGRKTLAHELTHVAQYKDKRINKNNTIAELEKEADISAGQEEYITDSFIKLQLNNKTYRMKKLETMVADGLAEAIERKIYEQKYILSEDKYLKLLLEYKKMLEKKDDIFNAL